MLLYCYPIIHAIYRIMKVLFIKEVWNTHINPMKDLPPSAKDLSPVSLTDHEKFQLFDLTNTYPWLLEPYLILACGLNSTELYKVNIIDI